MIDVEWNDNAKAAVKAYANFMDDYATSVSQFFESLAATQTKTVADEKQEGEKWTHTWNRDKCRVVFTEGDSSWIKGHFISTIVLTERLKPIKPTISDKQVASIIEAAAAWGIDPDDCQDYLSKFTVEGSEGGCNF